MSKIEHPILCEEGYMISRPDQFDCVKETEQLKNCRFTKDMQNCYECRINYYIDNGRCVKSPDYYFDLDWMKVEQVSEAVL